MSLNLVEIYTDGACKGNPGRGGWGALLRCGGKEKELFGGEANTTNNRMELQAVIEALNTLTRPCQVVLHTDSQYVRLGISEWIHGWKKRVWRASASDLLRYVRHGAATWGGSASRAPRPSSSVPPVRSPLAPAVWGVVPTIRTGFSLRECPPRVL